MPKKTQHEIPTEDEIMRQNNVPVEMAARYIGWSTPTLYYALQDQRAPFGVAVKSPKGVESVPGADRPKGHCYILGNSCGRTEPLQQYHRNKDKPID